MEHQIKGIVFQTIKYKDTQVIARIFTQEFGLKSFMIRSGKSAKSNVGPLLQPLNIVELTANFKENQKMITPKNLRLAVNYHSIPFDPVKTAVALFLDEVLYKTIADDYQNGDLFTFLEFSLLTFDQLESTRNFHLWFLIELTRYYGFYPQEQDESDVYFDLMQGETTSLRPSHRHYLEGPWKARWIELLDKKTEEVNEILYSGSERKYMLELLITYIQLHLESAREIKSLAILREVFS